ncbi:MAG: LacI family DNA-binding transcriptional regulator [Chloroflexota bacterium]
MRLDLRRGTEPGETRGELGAGGSATMAGVAERAGVSIATASRVFSGNPRVRPANRDRVLRAARELNYHVDARARGLSLRRTGTIGFVLTNVGDPFFAEILLGAEDAAAAADYDILVSTTRADPARERDALTLLREHRVDGAVLMDARQPRGDERLLALSDFAIVLIDPLQSNPSVSTIGMDNRLGGRLAAEHLIRLGHRRLAYLGRPGGDPNDHRLGGLRHAMATAGFDPASIRTIVAEEDFDSAERATEALLRSTSDVTALVCYNDVMAVGALQGCRRLGRRIPDDVSIVGFDDIVLARYLDPPLTTIRQPKYEIGYRAITMVLDLLARGSPQRVLLDGTLIERGSTAPP